jgi:hypothetical protein
VCTVLAYQISITTADHQVSDKGKDGDRPPANMEVYVNLRGSKSDSGGRWLSRNKTGLTKFQPRQVCILLQPFFAPRLCWRWHASNAATQLLNAETMNGWLSGSRAL